MGLVALHSAHYSKIMKLLMGTSMTLKWKHDESEYLWCIHPAHPIAYGVPERIILPQEEMYGEPFDIPKPDDVVFEGWFSNGYLFRRVEITGKLQAVLSTADRIKEKGAENELFINLRRVV